MIHLFCTSEFNPSTGLEMLRVHPIAKAQARQRCGRAGRECAGVCYRLFTESAYHQLEEDGVPEIQRCNLKGVLIVLLGIYKALLKILLDLSS